MMKPRNLVLLLLMSIAMLGSGTAVAADEPATSSDLTTTSDGSTDSSPLTLTQEQIDALQNQGEATDDNQSAFEKASDFVTDNAPWFIIGIIVLAAIVAGILIMRGRPRKSGTPKASKSTKQLRNAGGNSGDEPAQVPSASELRRRKRAAIQRSREEERLRRKSGIESRKAARRGDMPAPVTAAAAGATAVTAAGIAAGSVDPVEAEKQGARDQETAAAAMARFDTGVDPSAAVQAAPVPVVETQAAPTAQFQTVPAPVSPSQTAPAAGVVTPDQAAAAEPVAEPYAEPVAEPTPEQVPEPVAEPATQADAVHEPSIENPGADATVGNAARDFLAGGAVGAAGGFAAARSGQTEEAPAEREETLDPVVSPEPGMAAEHALADDVVPLPVENTTEDVALDPAPPEVTPEPGSDATAAAEERLRSKVAEIKATQQVAASAPPAVEEEQQEAELPAEPALADDEPDLAPGLAAVERKLSEHSEERDRTLREAEERLRQIEHRAKEAERRAAFAERLAQLKVEESERDKRLNQVVSGIDRAEQRAREAEARAEAAERAAAAALEQSDLNRPVPAPPAAPVAQTPEAPAAAVPTAPAETPAPAPVEEEPALPERRGLFSNSAPVGGADSSDAVNLNSATFEELREAGLSVTQATRILAYRERFGGYGSVEDLEKVPGFPADLIESLRTRLTI